MSMNVKCLSCENMIPFYRKMKVFVNGEQKEVNVCSGECLKKYEEKLREEMDYDCDTCYKWRGFCRVTHSKTKLKNCGLHQRNRGTYPLCQLCKFQDKVAKFKTQYGVLICYDCLFNLQALQDIHLVPKNKRTKFVDTDWREIMHGKSKR